MSGWPPRPRASHDEDVAHCLALLEHSQPWSCLVFDTPRRYGVSGRFEAYLWNHPRPVAVCRSDAVADLLGRLTNGGWASRYELSCLETLLALETL